MEAIRCQTTMIVVDLEDLVLVHTVAELVE